MRHARRAAGSGPSARRGSGGEALRATESLTGALAESGLRPASIEAAAFLVVDVVHGSALSAAAVERSDDAWAWFEQGLEIVIAGIRASVDP